MNSPLVSIIIPVFNRADFLGETLNSVCNQTYDNWECIVIDDGSTDNSLKVAKEYHQKDSRIRSQKRESEYKPGGCGARNNGADKSRGEYLIFLDSDDLLLEECVAQRIDCLTTEGAYDMLIFPTGTFKKKLGDSNTIWNIPFQSSENHLSLVRRFINQDMPWQTGGVLWRKFFFEKVGKWNETLKVWQDWELHLRALMAGPALKIYNSIPDNFYRRKVEGSIASRANTLSYFYEVSRTIIVVYNEPHKKNLQTLSKEYFALLARNLVLNPISLKYYMLPLKLILKAHIAKGKLALLKLYLQRLCMESYRFRKISGWKLDSDNLKKYYPRVSHLKLDKKILNHENYVLKK